jgi:organic radical activating enzyme
MSKLQEVNKKLNSVGCGFCLAKWTQVTIHLGTGMTHSCHHPAPHKINLREIKRNPSALHNTRFKKEKRREMLSNKRPDECNYCWNVEDNSSSYSDRTFKSSEQWSWNEFDKISKSNWRDDFNPKYVEVSFSNTCNFKCAYCGPQYSSKWVEEIEQYGAYKTSTNYNQIDSLREKGEMPYKQSEENPYVDAFWKWWPDLYKDLHTFRITGGEPLLSKDTFKVLEYIQENWEQNPNLSLAINTNMNVPEKLMNKFIELCKDLSDNNKVRELIIYTSVEGTDKQAEYTRFGLNYETFWTNVDTFLTRLPKMTINIMATFNALSVFTYSDLIDRVFEMKKKHQNKNRYWVSAIQLDTSYLRWPSHLSIKILDDEHKELILKSAKKALYYGIKEFTHDNYGFSNVEIQKIKRIYDYSISNSLFDVDKNRKDFIKFVDELDIRRGTNFLETFPQLKEFYARNKKGKSMDILAK